MNFYQHAKNWPISPIYSGDVIELKVLQSDWLRALSKVSIKSKKLGGCLNSLRGCKILGK